ncbi:MAG: glycerol-3-phosphate dehydrogenase/oxidase, partial [Acidimicrobiia bacterium]
ARVALVDRGDFAGFTSEQSSNLVWGGFKYLENYEFRLVRNLCRSRNRLIRAYPANIREIRFLAALDRNAPYRPWFATAGALAYWLIGNGFLHAPRHVGRRRIAQEEPVVDTHMVRGGIEYSDAYLIDNDSRFVLGFVRAALESGGAVVNYVTLEHAERKESRWRVQLRDTTTGREMHCVARVLVNATGPFADQMNAAHGIETRHRLVLSKGIHLIVPAIGRHDRVLAFFDDTKRLFYVIPMGPCSVIGTTDERVTNPRTHVDADDRKFLLDQINARLDLPAPLEAADVISERSGVRPLVVERAQPAPDDADWTALSRRHAIESDRERGHITILGGKLTDCLNIGREVGDHVQRLGVKLRRDRHDWYGEPPEEDRHELYRQARLMDLYVGPGRHESVADRLWRRYGQRAFAMLEAIREEPRLAEEVIEGTEYLRCELGEAASSEMVTKLEDFLRRRSKIAMVMRHDDLARSGRLQEAGTILFGADAAARHAEYFDATGTGPA